MGTRARDDCLLHVLRAPDLAVTKESGAAWHRGDWDALYAHRPDHYPLPMPSLALAFEDFVPVLLTAFGLLLIVRMIRRVDPGAGAWAALGAVLVVAGGLSRASWKLVMAAGGPDLVPLFLALYVLLATGYLLLVMALWRGWQAANGRRARVPTWAAAAVAIAVLLPLTAVMAPAGGRILPLLWLFTATSASVITALLLARWARAIGRPGLGWLFVVSMVVTLLLNGLARAETQSEALQWAEQLLNTLNQAAFLLGAILLERATRGAPADPARTRAEVTPAPAMGTPES